MKFKNSLIVLLGLVAFALSYSQEKVVVTNTTFEPVPTVAQGTTKVAGTILVDNTAAAPALVRDVNAASATHLGRKASEMVSLSGLFNANGEIFSSLYKLLSPSYLPLFRVVATALGLPFGFVNTFLQRGTTEGAKIVARPS